MAELRLYKDFYYIKYDNSNNNIVVRNPITPFSLSVYTSGGTNIIETLTPTQESTGKYYIDVDPELYDWNNANYAIWTVKYTQNASNRILTTEFKIDPDIAIIGYDIDIDIMGTTNNFEKNFTIKRNDTFPTLIVKIKTKGCLGEVLPLDLSGVTATTFSMKSECGDLIISSQQAQVIDSDNGVIQYQWQAGDTSESGRYMGEFELFFTGGGKITIPKIGNINIDVINDINET